MKNISFPPLLFFVFMTLLISCQKEKLETSLQQQTFKINQKSSAQNYQPEPIQQIRQNQIARYASEKKHNMIKNSRLPTHTARRGTLKIACEESKTSSTIGADNQIDIYENKSDKLFLLQLEEPQAITIKLSALNSDLDLFITDILEDSLGNKQIGNVLAHSINYNTTNETISIQLNAGSYFIIVETYKLESNFLLNIRCQANESLNYCEDFEDLELYEGISDQSIHWNLWNEESNDAFIITTEDTLNKAIEIDFQKYGYQDVVKDLAAQTLTTGNYWIHFDLYVPEGGVAKFSTEKTRNYGQEQGLMIEIKNEQIFINHLGRVYPIDYHLTPDTWHQVLIAFNAPENIIEIMINGRIQITTKATSSIGSCYGQKSIQGINFYGDHANSKFQIDNICIEEADPYILATYGIIVCFFPEVSVNLINECW
jgi:hypothetical protein